MGRVRVLIDPPASPLNPKIYEKWFKKKSWLLLGCWGTTRRGPPPPKTARHGRVGVFIDPPTNPDRILGPIRSCSWLDVGVPFDSRNALR